MIFVEDGCLPYTYNRLLTAMDNCGQLYDCPDWETSCLESPAVMVVHTPTQEPRISRLFPGGPRELEQYRQEILDGILDFEIERGNWSYTYHDRIAWQLPRVREILRENPYSRRAIIDVRTPDDMNSDDPACLQHIQFQIRGGRLNMSVLFRSNDVCKATFMNAFALICLQEREAQELGVEVGSYTHIINNAHVYKRDIATLSAHCDRIWNFGHTTYNYAGDWDELMDEAKPSIAEAVEKARHMYD